MELLKITVLLSFSFGAFVLATAQFSHTEYGQPCATGERACFSINITDPLVCNATSKICVCHPEMFRLEEHGRCVSPHGSPCTLQSGNGEPIRKCADFAQCWPDFEEKPGAGINAVEVSGKCYCDRDAKLDNVTGRCLLTHGSKRCELETQCNIKASLTCLEGECVCVDPENQIYEGEECITLKGGSCARQEPFPTPKCGKNMNCADNICQCLEGFEETATRTCGMVYDGKCEVDSDCHPQFMCREVTNTTKQCRCRDGHEYHPNNKKCYIQVGNECNATTTDFECSPHASCSAQGKCTCNEGYQDDTVSKKCIALFGSECSEEEGTTCNAADYLVCTDKTCQCKQNYTPFNDEKKCKGDIDQECRNVEDCIANSVCSLNICTCGEKQIPQDDKKACVALLDGGCDTITQCSQNHHLICIGSTCGCTNTTLRDEANSRCVAKAGSPCGDAANGIECTANATCPPNVQVCNCYNGFQQGGNGLCVNQNTGSGSCSIFGFWSLPAFVLLGVLSMKTF